MANPIDIFGMKLPKDSNEYHFEDRSSRGQIDSLDGDKADKATTVTAVTYDTTNKKFVETINGSTIDVVTTAELKADMALSNVENKSSETIRSELSSGNVTSALGYTPMNAALKGANNGVAELGSDGKVPSSQLPSYVDDVVEKDSRSAFPATGETGKIYVSKDTNLTYRWTGSTYVEISPSLALGTTSSTAFRGDHGSTAYSHATDSARLTTTKESGLYKIAVTQHGHVAAVTPVTKDDITGLGVPAVNTNTTYTITQDQADGHKFTFTGSDGSSKTITIPDNNTTYSLASLGIGNVKNFDQSKAIKSITRSGTTFTYTCLDGTTGTFNQQDSNTWIAMVGATSSSNGTAGYVPAPPSNGYNEKYLRADGAWVKPPNDNTTYTLSQDSADGHRIILTPSSGTPQTITIPDNDTTYSNATQSSSGLMSASDKTKLDGIATGATDNIGTITGIKMNGVSKGTSGVVDLGTVVTDISGKADKSAAVSTVAYDTSLKKITKTINGTTSDIVSVSTLKSDMSLSKADVGLGNVENKSSETIRGELTSSNVTNALGYTPPRQDTTYSNKTAVDGGTDVSLVSTGEKAVWNAKVTSVNGKYGVVQLTHSDVGAAATSHTHNVNQITDFPTLGSAAAKSVDASITAGSTSVNLPTSAAVASYVDAAMAAGGVPISNDEIDGLFE